MQSSNVMNLHESLRLRDAQQCLAPDRQTAALLSTRRALRAGARSTVALAFLESDLEDSKIDAPPPTGGSNPPSKRLIETTVAVALLAMAVAGAAAGFGSQARGANPETTATSIVGAVLAVLILPTVTIAILAIFPSKRNGRLFTQVYLGWSIGLVILNLLQLLQLLGGHHS